jgi:hypothetical protein
MEGTVQIQCAVPSPHLIHGIQMNKLRLAASSAAIALSALPLSELYAECTYTPTTGGYWAYCDNGRCWSYSFFYNNNKIAPETVQSGCRY